MDDGLCNENRPCNDEEEAFVEEYALCQLMWTLAVNLETETKSINASILASLLDAKVKQKLKETSIQSSRKYELVEEGELRGNESYRQMYNQEYRKRFVGAEDLPSIETGENVGNTEYTDGDFGLSTLQEECSDTGSSIPETPGLQSSDIRPLPQCAPMPTQTSSSIFVGQEGNGSSGNHGSDQESDGPKTIDLARNPLSLTGPAAKKALDLPSQTQSLNNAFLRHLRSELDLRGGLVAGMVDIASVFMLYWVHVLLGRASPSDFEKNGKLCVDVLQDTIPVIAEAKRATGVGQSSQSDKEYYAFNASQPLGAAMNGLEKTLESRSNDTSAQAGLARHADAAYKKAELPGVWYKNTKLGNSTMCFLFVMGQANASFRVLQMITLKQFIGSIGRGMNDKSNKNLLLNLCTIFLEDFDSIDKSSYTMLMVYENVLVPAVLCSDTSLDGIAVLDFVCTQIIRKKYLTEWAITQQIPMNKTLEDMGGKETMMKWIDSQDPQNLEKYLTDEDSNNNRKRRASRILSCPLAATKAVGQDDPSGFLYSFLCAPASNYLRGYDFVVDPDFLSRQIDEEFAKELKTFGSSIVSTRAKRERGFRIPLYVDNSSPCSGDIDPEDARDEKIELYEAFFAISISTPQVEVDSMPSLPPLPVFDTVEAV